MCSLLLPTPCAVLFGVQASGPQGKGQGGPSSLMPLGGDTGPRESISARRTGESFLMETI